MISYLPEIEAAKKEIYSIDSILEPFHSFCRDRAEEVVRAQDPKVRVNRLLKVRIHQKPLSTRRRIFESPECLSIKHTTEILEPWTVTKEYNTRIPLRKNLGVMVSPKRLYLFYFGGGYRFRRRGWTAYYPDHMDLIPVSHPQDLQILGLSVPSPEESKVSPIDPIELARFLPGPLRELKSFTEKLCGPSKWGRFEKYWVIWHESLLEVPEPDLFEDYKDRVVLFSVEPRIYEPEVLGFGIREIRRSLSSLLNAEGIVLGRDRAYLKVSEEETYDQSLRIHLIPTEGIGPKAESILYLGYMGRDLLLPLSKEALRIAIRCPYEKIQEIQERSRRIRRVL